MRPFLGAAPTEEPVPGTSAMVIEKLDSILIGVSIATKSCFAKSGQRWKKGGHLKVELPFSPSTTVHCTLKSVPDRADDRSLQEDRLYDSPPSSTAPHVLCTGNPNMLDIL